MADYELIGLNEAAPDLRAPTSADRGIIAGGVRVVGLAELDGGADINGFPLGPTAINPLRQAVRVAMTAAASGSSGITVLNNANVNLGTNNFTLHWEGSLPDWSPATTTRLWEKFQDASNLVRFAVIDPSGTLRVTAIVGGVTLINTTSTVVTGLADGSAAKVSAVVVRETASTAGSVTFYINGVQLGAAVTITAAATVSLDNSGTAYISGTGASRTACDLNQAIIYNRALSAAEVLSLCVNGPAAADIGASQVAVFTSDFSAGLNNWSATGGVSAVNAGNVDIDADGAGVPPSNDWQRSLRSGSAGQVGFYGNNVAITPPVSALGKRPYAECDVFIPSGSPITHITCSFEGDTNTTFAVTAGINRLVFGGDVLTTSGTRTPFIRNTNGAKANVSVPDGTAMYLKNFTWKYLGITVQLNAEDAQSNTGQIFDRSGNKNHALLPAAGATIIGRPTAQPQQVRWTNTWNGTHELQYIGGVNQAILPANAYIDSIVGTVSGATPHDIIVGDGTDADRYVTITTGLATGTTTFTVANRTTDGTNLKLTVDPDTNCTMSIAWVISYRILE